jgi:hypothetical protein
MSGRRICNVHHAGTCLMHVVAVVLVLSVCALFAAGCGSGGATGLYRVSVAGKWGYIDKTGALKIQPQFGGAADFSDGLAAVSVDYNNKWGYIDPSGTLVIQPQYGPSLSFPFSEGLAVVGEGSAENERYGCIDKTGTVVIPPQFELAPSHTWQFSEGLCKVMVQEAGQQRWGFIDKTGALVIKAQFSGASDFSEGLAAVDTDGDAHGFIDKTGKWAIQLPTDLQLDGGLEDKGFSEGLALAQGFVPGDAQHPFLRGYIAKTGKVVIQLQFVAAFSFSEGLAAAEVNRDGALKWGYIDKRGAWVVQPQFDAATPFQEGLAAVATGSGDSVRWSFIDKTGKVAFALPQNMVPTSVFSGGVAAVRDATANYAGPTEYIDTTGKVIWEQK